MIRKSIAAGAILFAACAAGGGHGLVPQAQAACDPGTKIDATTGDQAQKKIASGGYLKVRMLKKGCDNVWHASAEKDGAQIFVALTPDGHVYPEGD